MIKRLQAKHKMMLEMALSGATGKAIAEEMCITQSTASLIINAPIFQHELATRRGERDLRADVGFTDKQTLVNAKLQEAAMTAADTQVDLLFSHNESIKQRSAMDILDRAGFPRITKQENTQKSIVLTLEGKDILRMQEASKDAFEEDFDIVGMYEKRTSQEGGPPSEVGLPTNTQDREQTQGDLDES